MTTRTADEIQDWLVSRISQIVKVSAGQIDVGAEFDSLGLGSKDSVELSAELEQLLGRRLPPTLVWDYPTIAELSGHLAQKVS
jgi:acyl carrier protein